MKYIDGDNNMKTAIKIIVKLIIAVLIVFAILWVLFSKETNISGSAKTTVTAILDDETTISQLNILRMPYAGVFKKKILKTA